jgi:hypothetical protein
MQIALLGERNEPVGDAAEILRLRQRGDDLLVLDQGASEAREQGRAMARGTIELPACFAVTHLRTSGSQKPEAGNQKPE